VFTEPGRPTDVGPLQALIDELEFNAAIASNFKGDDVGCHFYDEQFRRAIMMGAISILKNELKQSIIAAYRSIGKANHVLQTWTASSNYAARVNMQQEVMREVAATAPHIGNGINELLKFLGREAN
jgi:hypothetical protein